MSYRVATIDGATVTPRAELNPALQVQWQRGEGAFFVKKLGSDVEFGSDDFAFWSALAVGGECSEIKIEVQAMDGAAWPAIWSGKATPSRSRFHFDRCLATLKTETDDATTCFRKQLGAKKNWLVGPPKTLFTLLGTVDEITCNFSNQPAFGAGITLPAYWRECWMTGGGFTLSNAPDPALAWRPIEHQQIITTPAAFPNPALWSGFTKWGRERITSAVTPSGAGWVNIGGDQWVRPLGYALELVPVMVTPSHLEVEAKIITKQFSGGRLLKNALSDVLVGTCGITKLRSCFLGKNDDATAPVNGAYAAAARFKNVLLFQTSDITNPDADADASRLELTVQEMLDLLGRMFLTWRIEKEGADTVLRIEHVSYFFANNPFDIAPFALEMAGNREIDFGTGPTISREVYSDREAENSLFRPHTVQYPLGCTDGSENQVGYRNLLTDFGFIAENMDISDDGAVFVAADLIGEFLLIDTTDGYLNGAFSWRNVLFALGRYERLFSAFFIQGQSTTALSLLNFSKVPPVVFKMSHIEAAEFDPSGLVVGHFFGDARLETANYDVRKERMTLNLSI